MSGGWNFGFRIQPTEKFIYPEMPVFVRFHQTIQAAEERTPFEVARMTEGRSVFSELKRWLDHADLRYAYGAQSQPDWRAADKAKMGMEDELKRIGAWDDSLLETGVT